MEEVEFLCNRVTIMIDGEFQCLGSISHLKSKYAQGYTMTVKTHIEFKDDEDYTKKVLRAIANTFPESKLRESYEVRVSREGVGRLSQIYMATRFR